MSKMRLGVRLWRERGIQGGEGSAHPVQGIPFALSGVEACPEHVEGGLKNGMGVVFCVAGSSPRRNRLRNNPQTHHRVTDHQRHHRVLAPQSRSPGPPTSASISRAPRTPQSHAR